MLKSQTLIDTQCNSGFGKSFGILWEVRDSLQRGIGESANNGDYNKIYNKELVIKCREGLSMTGFVRDDEV